MSGGRIEAFVASHGLGGHGYKSLGRFEDVAGALGALRSLRECSPELRRVPARVLFEPGTYFIGKTISIGPEDSFVTFEPAGEGEVVFTGARGVEGFVENHEHGRRSWRAELPSGSGWPDVVRSFFVNGRRCPRVRTPKFDPQNNPEATHRIAEIRTQEPFSLFAGDDRFRLDPVDCNANWSFSKAEVVVLHHWLDERMTCPVRMGTGDWLRFSERSTIALREVWWGEKTARYFIENVPETLSDPGEWYFDRETRVLTYLPLNDECLETSTLAVSVLVRCLEMKGETFLEQRGDERMDAAEQEVVTDVVFRNINFEQTDWVPMVASRLRHSPSVGGTSRLASSMQAACDAESAIVLQHAQACGFESCKFRNLGAHAIAILSGSRDCWVRHSEFHNVGASAVRIDGADIDEPVRDRTLRIEFSDNRVERTGRNFLQAPAVFVQNARDCGIRHNKISDTTYSAVSLGWSWGLRDTISGGHTVEGNRIANVGNAILSDLGGIYLVGKQAGTLVRWNHISGVRAHEYAGAGIYLDDGASHVVVEENFVEGASSVCVLIHCGRENIIRRNVLQNPGAAFLGLGRAERWLAATFIGNLLVGSPRAVFQGGYQGDIATGIFSEANRIAGCDEAALQVVCPSLPAGDPGRRRNWLEWKALGNDRHSVVGKPKEFSWQEEARQNGIKPEVWEGCGPRRAALAPPTQPAENNSREGTFVESTS